MAAVSVLAKMCWTRVPETEALIEAALSEPFDHVLDLGLGSGCILITLLAEHDGTSGVGVDLSESACLQASANAVEHQVQARAEILRSDWFENIEGQFDLMCFQSTLYFSRRNGRPVP